MPVNTRIQFRRGTAGAGANQWTDQILYAGEVGYETDTGLFKIGDGTTAWSSLSYAAVKNIVAGSGISISNVNGTYTVNLSDPTIQAADVTDFNSAVSGLVEGTYARLNGAAFTGDVSISNQTANTVASFDASKNVVSLSTTTYPSLTELSYVKGVTSAIQTQLDSKVPNTRTLTPGSGLAGSSALDLSANRTFDVGAGDGITVSTDAVAVNNTVVRTSGSQTIAGSKTFSNTIIANSGLSVGNINIDNSINTIWTTDGNLNLSATNQLIINSDLVDVNGDISVNNLTVSGSGLLASNINNFNTSVRNSRLDQMAAPTTSVSFNSQKITNLAAPTSPDDAATKAYVDASRLGLDVKDSVRVATTADITLSGTQTIDGVSVIAGDRVLVKDQNTGSQNGIYVVAAGAWSRATDADVNAEVTAGMFTFVAEGSTNADSGWVLTTNDAITLGTTALVFAQFSGAGQITAGAGLTKNGSTIDVGTASSSRIVVNADSIDLASVTQSDGSGAAGTSFVQAVTRDSYGRVTGITTGSVQDASTSAKGIASFDSNTFNVTSGAVSVKNSGITNSQLAFNSITLGSVTQTLGSSYNTLAGLSAISGTSAGSPTTLTFCVIDGGTP